MSASRLGPRGGLALSLLGASMIFSACWGPTAASPPVAAEEEEERTLQVTVWNSGYEIFLEHVPIVGGEAVKFITHVTDLETLRPRTEGPVTFILKEGAAAGIEIAEPAPARPGIYIPTLEFPRPGTWSVALRIPNQQPRAGETLVELPPFTVHPTVQAARTAPAPDAPEGIAFLKEQQWKVRTRAEPAARRRLVERLRLTGETSAPAGSRAAVTSPFAGHLLAPPGGGLPVLGQDVKAGEVLALVRPPFSSFAVSLVEAEAEAIEARLAVNLAAKTYERVEMLAEDRTRSIADLQEAAFARDVARAKLEAAEAKQAAIRKAGAILLDSGDGELAAVELKAPITGTVIRIGAAIGEHVTPERSIFEILDTGRVHVTARVPETDLGRVSESLGAVVETPDEPESFIPILDGSGQGRVVLPAIEVEPATRTAAIVYELPNPAGRLRPGLAVTVHVETARVEDALAIPGSAVVDEEGQPVAFVQVAGETFQKRSLRLGLRDRGFVQVLEGISEGEQVVVEQAYAIRLASVSTTIPAHGHAH